MIRLSSDELAEFKADIKSEIAKAYRIALQEVATDDINNMGAISAALKAALPEWLYERGCFSYDQGGVYFANERVALLPEEQSAGFRYQCETCGRGHIYPVTSMSDLGTFLNERSACVQECSEWPEKSSFEGIIVRLLTSFRDCSRPA